MEGTRCRRDIRAAPVMLGITTVGRPDLVFDDDEGDTARLRCWSGLHVGVTGMKWELEK